MKAKAIAFLIHGMNSGGAERVVSLLANRLVEENEVCIITHKRTEPFYALDPRIKVIPCFESLAPSTNTLQSIYRFVRLLIRVTQILKKQRIDLCIGFITTSNVMAVLAGRFRRIPVIISERNNPYSESTKLSSFWKKLRKWSYPKANKLVVQTQGIKRFYNPLISDHKLVVIPNPIMPFDLDRANSEKRNIVLNVGRLDPQKDQAALIRAFIKAKPEMSWELHIIGDGPLRDSLQQLIDTHSEYKDRIRLLGRRKHVNAYYLESSIFCLTSRYEGFPNVLLEAMHMGLPAVSTNCPTGPSELIKDGENGFLVPLDEEDLLAARLKALMDQPDLRKLLGSKARASTFEYEVDKIAQQWIELIDSCLKPGEE